MTRFRYWLADLISGGELTAYKNDLGQVLDRSMRIDGIRAHTIETLRAANNDANADHTALARRFHLVNAALCAIAAEAKPTSNATVKRMARIAQEALK